MSDPVDSGLPAVPRLRASLPTQCRPSRLRFQFAAATSLICNRVKLTRELCDEPFRIRDVQFDYPAVAVS